MAKALIVGYSNSAVDSLTEKDSHDALTDITKALKYSPKSTDLINISDDIKVNDLFDAKSDLKTLKQNIYA